MNNASYILFLNSHIYGVMLNPIIIFTLPRYIVKYAQFVINILTIHSEKYSCSKKLYIEFSFIYFAVFLVTELGLF